MTAGFDALCDQSVGAGAFRGSPLPGRADLTDDDHARIAEAPHEIRTQIPEQRHDWNLELDAVPHLCLEQIGRCRRRDDVDAEGSEGSAPHGLDLTAYELGWLPHHAEKAEAACSRDGERKLDAGDPSHTGKTDRILAAEEVADLGSQGNHCNSFQLAS